jgi:hypothetical protein
MSRLNSFTERYNELVNEHIPSSPVSVSERLCICMGVPFTEGPKGAFRVWRHQIKPKSGISNLSDVLFMFQSKCWLNL